MTNMLYLEREQDRNDINLQLDRSDLRDPVGCLQQSRVIGASCGLLVIDDQSLVHVVLGEGGRLLLSAALQEGTERMPYSPFLSFNSTNQYFFLFYSQRMHVKGVRHFNDQPALQPH